MSQQSKTHNPDRWVNIWMSAIIICMIAWIGFDIAKWETARFLAARCAAIFCLFLGLLTLDGLVLQPFRKGSTLKHPLLWFLGLGFIFGCLSNSCDSTAYQRCYDGNTDLILSCSQYLEAQEDIHALHEDYSNASWLEDTEMTEIETPITDTHDEVMVFVKDNKEQWALGFASVSNRYIRIRNHYFASDDAGIQTIQNIGINKQQFEALPSSGIGEVGSLGGFGFLFLLMILRDYIREYVLTFTNESVDNQDSKMWFQVQFFVQILLSMFGFGTLFIMIMCIITIFFDQIVVGGSHLIEGTNLPPDVFNILDPSVFQFSVVVLFAYFILGYVDDALQILYTPEFTLTQVMKRFRDSYPLSKEGIPQIPKSQDMIDEHVLLFLSLEHVQMLRKIKADPSSAVLFKLGYRKYLSPELDSPLSLSSSTHTIQPKSNVVNDEIEMWRSESTHSHHNMVLLSPFWPWCSPPYSHPSFTFELEDSNEESKESSSEDSVSDVMDAKRKEARDTEIARVVEKNTAILTLISTMEQTGLLKVHPSYFEITSYAERLLLYPDIHFDKNIPFWVHQELAKIHASIFSTIGSPYDGTLTSNLSELLERYLKEKIMLLVRKSNIEDALPKYRQMLPRMKKGTGFAVLDFTSGLSFTTQERIQEQVRKFLNSKDPSFVEHPEQPKLIQALTLMIPLIKVGGKHQLKRKGLEQHLSLAGFAPDVISAMIGSAKTQDIQNMYDEIGLSLSMEREWLTSWFELWIDEQLSTATLGPLQDVLQGLLTQYGATDKSVKSLKNMMDSLKPIFELVRDKRNQQAHHQVSDNQTSNTDFYDSFEYFSLAKTFIYAVAELEKQVTK